ncbi:hypothetical protein TSAR_012882, partial [Trichomalopsis sarcophagae]
LGPPIPNNDVALEEEVKWAEFSDTDASLEDGFNGKITVINYIFTNIILEKSNVVNHTCHLLQHGEGSEPRFIIERESVRLYRRFGYEGREIQGTISQPPTDANVYDWLERCMRNLHRQLCGRGRSSDFIGITLNSENFKHLSLWLSFRLIRNFHADDRWKMLFNTINLINCAIVESVVGSGLVKLTKEPVNKSILCIRIDDNLCLPRSLVAAYAYAVRGQIRKGNLHDYWNLIRQNRGRVQKKAAEKL